MSLNPSELAEVGRCAGLDAVGFCTAEPFSDTADALIRRKQAGLHAGMQFTYRNPQRSTDPRHLLPGAAALVVGAVEFEAQPAELQDASTSSEVRVDNLTGVDNLTDTRPWARVAAYARSDYYAVLRKGLEAVAEALRSCGYQAVVTADSNALVDRAAAHRSGIGWWGKNSNILLPGLGSLVVLGSVVTDAAIVTSDPEPLADGCGTCQKCLDGCPTGAIIAAGTVDARRCLAWLVQADGVFDPEYRVALGDRIYGCDDCSDVCPPNRLRIRRTSNPDSDTPNIEQQSRVDVLELLEASDEELLRRFGRWYIPRREPRYLRRNALVVLANVGDPRDPKVRSALEQALRDSDPLIRAHGVWCCRRLGLDLTKLQGADDPLVAAELRRSVPLRAAL